MKIKIKLFKDQKMPVILDKGDWIDLAVAEDVVLKTSPMFTISKQKEDGKTVQVVDYNAIVKYIPLGVAMKLPKGYEAVIAPRSSTAKKMGILQANSIGIIDESYCGDNDEWMFPAIPIRDIEIKKGTRICQFRIQLSQKATVWQKIKWVFCSKIKLIEVDKLTDTDRSGLGSTGV